MTVSEKILIAGATGYLGTHLTKQLLRHGCDFQALARYPEKLNAMGLSDHQIRIAQVTDPASLKGCCDGVDVVISCIGITRQRDGLGYMDVDYQANLNLLLEAERAGVKRFIYISAFNAPKFQMVRLLKAKERFASRLLISTIAKPCVIRPNGFFSDMTEFYKMAKRGRVYLFGTGKLKLNPIHGDDLANFCLEAIETDDKELDVGGPQILTHREIADIAFRVLQQPAKVTCLPDWLRKSVLAVARLLPEQVAGPVEFFAAATAQDMVAPVYGQHTLEAYFQSLHAQRGD
ncbi:SDR family oxidoreductase [Photobacterium galatheae]|uniref:NAD-dependent dehydratase n=1 Tax=Photobacterium galatheae TaxID=1654360 RepID=A0A066RKE0_9GAMM|nr:SDR family oxidoreductase [Photobacterium galatheae]KDM90794.1 NAD-dependent dehydratase [Photobacterium galatheae]MCM0149877.1 SDR family oxidoreductase [Photobacterium galatheae]